MCFRKIGRWNKCVGLNGSNVLGISEDSAELRDKVHLHSTGHCPGLKNETPDAEIDISTFCNCCHHGIFLKAHV